MNHNRYPGGRLLATGTVAAVAYFSLVGCSSSDPKPAPRYVEAVIDYTQGSLHTTLTDGTETTLANGTKVTVECFAGNDPTPSYETRIDSGKYAGKTAMNVLGTDLQNTTDPFHAAEQTPPQDPYAGLDRCP